jgi:GxxExxY protein
MALNGLRFEREKVIPLRYRDALIEVGFRLDFLVENSVIVEIKAVEQLLPIHTAQLMTYLKLTGAPLGFLMNFNVLLLKDGTRRVVMQRGTRR